MKTIFITGGHLTPALAVMERLPLDSWRIFYIGRKHSLEGDPALSQEYLTIQRFHFTFLPLTTGRLQRTMTRFSLVSLLKMPVGFLQAVHYVSKYKPDVILTFGGYVAVPIVLAGWLHGIPTVTHEQTIGIGLANKIISLFSRKICIAWKMENASFPRNKTVYTGNPLRLEVLYPRQSLPMQTKLPLVYITGGNQGSHSLNVTIERALPDLLTKYTLIHQCGNASEFKDYERLVKIKDTLPAKLKDRYYPFQFIESKYIGWVLKSAAVVISRAGANMITELIALSKIAILIPLPWAGENEQSKNAEFLAKRGAAEVIEQKYLTPEILIQAVDKILKKKDAYMRALRKLKHLVPPDAAEKIIHVVESVV